MIHLAGQQKLTLWSNSTPIKTKTKKKAKKESIRNSESLIYSVYPEKKNYLTIFENIEYLWLCWISNNNIYFHKILYKLYIIIRLINSPVSLKKCFGMKPLLTWFGIHFTGRTFWQETFAMYSQVNYPSQCGTESKAGWGEYRECKV